jgi:hypothetical protein
MKNILVFLVLILASTLFTPKASADEITLNLNASMIYPNGDGSIYPLVYEAPTLFVTGTMSFDTAIFNRDMLPVPLAFDLNFSWLGGGFEYTGIGSGNCADYSFLSPGFVTCYFHPPLDESLSWGFQTNGFNSLALTPGTTFGACAARTTIYPDGELGLGSGICGGTSGANILGHSGVVYGLRLDEGGGSSGTFEVVATGEPGMMLWTMVLLAGIFWAKGNRKSS